MPLPKRQADELDRMLATAAFYRALGAGGRNDFGFPS